MYFECGCGMDIKSAVNTHVFIEEGDKCHHYNLSHSFGLFIILVLHFDKYRQTVVVFIVIMLELQIGTVC